MKKKNLFLFGGIFAALIILIVVLNQAEGDTVYGKPRGDLNPQTRAILNDENYQNIILPNELAQAVQSADGTFVYFFAPDCSFCRETTPKLNPIAEELNVELKQMNLREFEDQFGKYRIEYTPTLVYFENGQEIARLEGGLVEGGAAGNSADDFRAFLALHSGQETG